MTTPSGRPPTRVDRVVFPPPHNTDAKATAALVLGIVGVIIAPTFVCAVLATIFGYQAREETALNERSSGSGMATAGFVLGVVGLVLGALFVMVAVATG
jgi:hypothetical protein